MEVYWFMIGIGGLANMPGGFKKMEGYEKRKAGICHECGFHLSYWTDRQTDRHNARDEACSSVPPKSESSGLLPSS